MELTLEEFVEKYGQEQTAAVLGVTQGAVSLALRWMRKFIFVMKKDGTIIRVYEVKERDFKKIKLRQLDRS